MNRPVFASGAAALCVAMAAPALADPLPSWNDTEARSAIIEFVDGVTDPESGSYVTPDARIAVFDNDGTLWAERPVYFQFLFAMDRARALAEADPGWATTGVLQAAADGDIGQVLGGGEEALLEVIGATHSGMSVEAFQDEVRAWLETARHPETGMAYDGMVYQPMLELLSYLRDEDFRTYIVSGGGIDFMRAFAEKAYGIPPEQVIGSMGELTFEMVDGAPEVVKTGGLAFLDDKGGKPVGIMRDIGRRPIFVGGNSDGDMAMLQWATAGDGPRFGLIVHHTDAEREWAYDREGPVGTLDEALDLAPEAGWLLVDMAEDWSDDLSPPVIRRGRGSDEESGQERAEDFRRLDAGDVARRRG